MSLEPALQQYVYDVASDVRYAAGSLEQSVVAENAAHRLTWDWMKFGSLRNVRFVLQDMDAWARQSASPYWVGIAKLNRHC